jgi:hypothetical protein
MPALRRDHDPQGLQAPRGGGLPDRRGEQACGEGEVDSARASVDLAPAMGATAAGFLPLTVDAAVASSLEDDLRQALDDLGISTQVLIERRS